MVNVSWNDAVAFCKWLSRKEGKTYRLPTEAEWEYACRAGTTTRYYSGDDPETLAKVGNVADATAKAKLPRVESTRSKPATGTCSRPRWVFKPNAFGLYDMHGNAWQWCSDWYGEKYYATSPKTIQPAQILAIAASFVAVPGTSGRTSLVPPNASGSRGTPGSSTSTRVFELPGLSNASASHRVSSPGSLLGSQRGTRAEASMRAVAIGT